MTAQKIPLILYSGGLDSTALVHERIDKTDVDLLTIVSEGVNRKNHRLAEEKARENYKEAVAFWKNEGSVKHGIRSHKVVKIPYAFVLHEFAQLPIWFTTAFMHVDKTRHSCVEMAYVTGDQFSYHAKDVQKAWDLLWTACNPRSEPVPLKFPFLQQLWGKEKIIENWGTEYSGFFWYCENPIKAPDKFHVCGKCPSCGRMSFSSIHEEALKQTKQYLTSLEKE